MKISHALAGAFGSSMLFSGIAGCVHTGHQPQGDATDLGKTFSASACAINGVPVELEYQILSPVTVLSSAEQNEKISGAMGVLVENLVLDTEIMITKIDSEYLQDNPGIAVMGFDAILGRELENFEQATQDILGQKIEMDAIVTISVGASSDPSLKCGSDFVTDELIHAAHASDFSLHI